MEKLVPVMVMTVPAGPDFGVKPLRVVPQVLPPPPEAVLMVSVDELVTAGPVGGSPVTVPVLVIDPANTSAKVVV